MWTGPYCEQDILGGEMDLRKPKSGLSVISTSESECESESGSWCIKGTPEGTPDFK